MALFIHIKTPVSIALSEHVALPPHDRTFVNRWKYSVHVVGAAQHLGGKEGASSSVRYTH